MRSSCRLLLPVVAHLYLFTARLLQLLSGSCRDDVGFSLKPGERVVICDNFKLGARL